MIAAATGLADSSALIGAKRCPAHFGATPSTISGGRARTLLATKPAGRLPSTHFRWRPRQRSGRGRGCHQQRRGQQWFAFRPGIDPASLATMCAVSSLGKICQGTAEKIFDARDRVTSGASDGGATDGKPGACDASPSACIVNPNVDVGASPTAPLEAGADAAAS